MSKAESAELILKLYELRREDTMREARNWMISFFPESGQDIVQALMNTETSAFYRMVMSYWDMAASFVNHGAIEEEMFTDANAEHFVVFAKIEPFLPELRETFGNPNMLANLEKLVMRQPNAKERLAKSRESMKSVMKARAEMSQSA
ncbi:MAG: hypothetical protein WKF90_10215 [Pyrinomonadaceae bacterium]|jgi:hypothetical protein|nr:hypothetical protein [Acidobacteriota bacterium]